MVEPRILDGNTDPFYRIRNEKRLVYVDVVSTLSWVILAKERITQADAITQAAASEI